MTKPRKRAARPSVRAKRAVPPAASLSATAYADWRARCEAVLSFLEEVDHSSQPHGEAWIRGTLRYYGNRLNVLTARPPKGAEREADAYTKRLLVVLDRFTPSGPGDIPQPV